MSSGAAMRLWDALAWRKGTGWSLGLAQKRFGIRPDDVEEAMRQAYMAGVKLGNEGWGPGSPGAQVAFLGWKTTREPE